MALIIIGSVIKLAKMYLMKPDKKINYSIYKKELKNGKET
jgi:hypothetical protein